MKKLENTLYITNPDYYLAKDGETITILNDNKVIKRFPQHVIGSIICFNYSGCSPALMRFCMENDILISFVTPQGKYCGRIIGETNGSILTRKQQYELSVSSKRIDIVRMITYAKLYNSQKLLKQFINDHPDHINSKAINLVIERFDEFLEDTKHTETIDSLRGIEGVSAKFYFSIFNELILNKEKVFKVRGRTKRPPMDPTNATLSFLYTMLTHECQSALEVVGLDSYMGFYHTDRSGRASLACDLVEEFRSIMVDRLTLTMINKNIIQPKHFEIKENDATLLNDKGREIILTHWQKQKLKEIKHPFLHENIPLGILPYTQAMLLSKYIRNEIDGYPAFLWKRGVRL